MAKRPKLIAAHRFSVRAALAIGCKPTTSMKASRVHHGAVASAVVGDEPALISDENRPVFQATNARWLIGHVVLGILASCLLAGALSVTVDKHAMSVELAERTSARPEQQIVVENTRGDPDRRTNRSGVARATVRFEQLNDAGSMQSYTRITTPLAEIVLAERSAAIGDRPKPDSASGLPPMILSGEPHPAFPSGANAYAEENTGEQREDVGRSLNETTVTEAIASHATRQHVVIARPDDTLPKILSALGVGEDEQNELLFAFARRRRLARGRFSGDEIVTVIQDSGEAGASAVHVLKVIVSKPGVGVAAVARSDDGRYARLADEGSDAAHQDNFSSGIDGQNAVSGVTLRDGLTAVARSSHLSDMVVDDVMRMCGVDFDLDRPLEVKDAASVLYAPDKSGRPELVFIGLTAQGKSRRYYHFKTPDDEPAAFYDEHGRLIGEHLLNNPTIKGRLGDGFGWRIHPILHERRFHEGVDYAAPYGSPIVAAAAGVVTVIGRKSGYGLYIRIQHDAGHETTYAHIAGVPGGLRIGDRVRQGETIAYVGSTGLSTGPHLYYEVWIDGQRVDPLRMRSVGGDALRGEEAQKFQQFTERINELLDVPSDIATGQ